MIFQTTIRFVATFVGALIAFYLAAHLFHAMGFMSAYELQHVGWMYRQILEPITGLDWVTQRTALIALAVLAVQAAVLAVLFRKWSYRPVEKIDPLSRLARAEGGVVASGARLPSRSVAVYTGLDDAAYDSESADHSAREERRLLAMLRQRPV